MKKPDFEHETDEQIQIWRQAYSYYFLNFRHGIGTLCQGLAQLWLIATGVCLAVMLICGQRLEAQEWPLMVSITLISLGLLGAFWWFYRRIDQRATDFAWEAVNDGARDERDIHNLYSSVCN